MKRCCKGLFVFLFVTCAVFSLSGCEGSPLNPVLSMQEAQETPLQKAQEYVTAVDSRAAELSVKADEYVQALGKGDNVAAKLKLEEVAASLDDLSNIEIPDSLKDEGEKYKQAATGLKEALNSLNDVANGKGSESDLKSKLQEAQQKYDEAAKNLSDADTSLQEKVQQMQSEF